MSREFTKLRTLLFTRTASALARFCLAPKRTAPNLRNTAPNEPTTEAKKTSRIDRSSMGVTCPSFSQHRHSHDNGHDTRVLEYVGRFLEQPVREQSNPHVSEGDDGIHHGEFPLPQGHRVAIGFDAMDGTVVLRLPLHDLKYVDGPLTPH
jgi:hypothetical protein